MNEKDYNNIKLEYKEAIHSDPDSIVKLIKPRAPEAYKGIFGHALIIAGSEGKAGASILSSNAVMRTGCGLLTAFVPETAVSPLLCSLPEAMVVSRESKDIAVLSSLSKYDAIGFGPGVGLDDESAGMLLHLLNHYHQSLVIDADGLNLLSENRDWYKLLNGNIILTPHSFEFDRLTQTHQSDAERIRTQVDFSKEHKVIVLLKGSHTSITTPEGQLYFNTTGNSGMATAGSGDVLTGVITSLCAQGYTPEMAAVLGAYLHGYAGDCAAIKYSKTSMIASDIIQCLSDFFIKYEK
jgi:hydroxyethylthiazole kinase-like uncharacterized protein yjeF